MNSIQMGLEETLGELMASSIRIEAKLDITMASVAILLARADSTDEDVELQKILDSVKRLIDEDFERRGLSKE